MAPHAARSAGRSEYDVSRVRTTLQCHREQSATGVTLRFPAFPAPNPQHLCSPGSQSSRTARGEESRVQTVLTREVAKSERDGNRLLSASLRKEKQENKKGINGTLNKHQHTRCIWRTEPLFAASLCCNGGDVESGAGDCGGRS